MKRCRTTAVHFLIHGVAWRSGACAAKVGSSAYPLFKDSPRQERMGPAWSYTATTVKPPDGSSARLTLHATAAVAASPDVVLDASTLALRCEISVDGTSLNPSTLVNSVSARYILDWLRLVSRESGFHSALHSRC